MPSAPSVDRARKKYSLPLRSNSIDVSPAEVDSHYIVDVGVLGELALSLQHMGKGLQPFDDRWARQQRARLMNGLEDEQAEPGGAMPRPQDIIRALRATLWISVRTCCMAPDRPAMRIKA